MRRADTTSEEHQAAYEGEHSPSEGSSSAPSVRGRFLACRCGWRLVEVHGGKQSNEAAARAWREHHKDMEKRRQQQATIGNVLVHEGEPPGGNPYRGVGVRFGLEFKNEPVTHVSGEQRAELLCRFRDGDSTEGFTFWHAPGSGGARRLSSPEEVDWRGMG